MYRTLLVILILALNAVSNGHVPEPEPQPTPTATEQEAPAQPTLTPEQQRKYVQEYMARYMATPQVIARARACLDGDFEQHETRYWIILTDANWESIEHVGRDLHATRHQFNRLCKVLGAARAMPTQKMVAIVFRDREDFISFARACDDFDVDPEGIGGYYSPSDGWLAFYEPRGQPSLKKAREELEYFEDSLEQHLEETDTAHLDEEMDEKRRKQVEGWSAALQARRDQLDDYEYELRTTVTAHEGFHQLSQLSGFTGWGNNWGPWLHEGFASCFETENTAYGFGPAYESRRRAEDFRKVLENDQVLPLHQLITVRKLGELGPEGLSNFYAQSHALVRWLYRFRRAQLNGYLRALRENPEFTFPNDDLLVFEKYFGPIEKLERRWLKDEVDGWSQKEPVLTRP